MRIAAWQMPIDATGACVAIDAVRHQVRRCEADGVTVLCCPEGAIGGLADYVRDPATIAIPTDGVAHRFAPINSDAVTVIVGFTELGVDGRLYNAAAVLHRGACVGIYRKLHPAIRRSIYAAGTELPVFRRGDLTFGIVICNDSNYGEPARVLAGKGASVLFIPSNNQLPLSRTIDGLTDEARACDVARATENGVWVVRADVTGRSVSHVSAGSSGIVDPRGRVVASASAFTDETLTFDLGRHELA
jgi:predicted amidohydrolase